MKHLLPLFLLLLLLLPGHALKIRRPMWQVPIPKTWNEARDHCISEFGGDLLTAVSQGELDQMDLGLYHVWLGLYSHSDHYHWEDAGAEHAADVWNPDQGQSCVLASYRNTTTRGASCSEKHFFYCSGLVSGFSFKLFIPEAKSKSDAQTFCMNRQMILSTFPGTSSLQWPGSPFYVAQEFPIWIGLHRNGGSWEWSDHNTSDFRNWAPDLGVAASSVQGPGSGSDCVSVWSQSKSMSVHSCSEAFPSLCYRHNVVLVQEPLTWEQGLETCRNFMPSTGSFRLHRFQQSEMDSVKNVLRFSTTSKVWVGLRFLGGSWFWSDGGAASLSSLPECPDPGLRCGALVLNGTSELLIEPSDCSLALNVLCYREP